MTKMTLPMTALSGLVLFTALTSAQASLSDLSSDYFAGSIRDRRTGEQIRMKCLDSDCAKITYAHLDRSGVELAVSKFELEKAPAPNTVDPRETDPVYLYSVATIQLIGGLENDQGTGLLFLPFLPIAVGYDLSLLPYRSISALDIANYRGKLKRFYQKKVTITHQRFTELQTRLFR